MEELFRFINVSCETSRFYLRNFSFMFGRGELIAISSDTTSAKDALVLLLTRHRTNKRKNKLECKRGSSFSYFL